MQQLESFMRQAIQAAAKAEYPFGAAVVKDDKLVALAGSGGDAEPDPTAHAEVNAIRQACRKFNTSNLKGCTLISSCEPCHLCFGALYYAGIRDIIFASSIAQMESVGWAWDGKDLTTRPETYKTSQVTISKGLLLNEVMAMYRAHPKAQITNNESRVTS